MVVAGHEAGRDRRRAVGGDRRSPSVRNDHTVTPNGELTVTAQHKVGPGAGLDRH